MTEAVFEVNGTILAGATALTAPFDGVDVLDSAPFAGALADFTSAFVAVFATVLGAVLGAVLETGVEAAFAGALEAAFAETLGGALAAIFFAGTAFLTGADAFAGFAFGAGFGGTPLDAFFSILGAGDLTAALVPAFEVLGAGLVAPFTGFPPVFAAFAAVAF